MASRTPAANVPAATTPSTPTTALASAERTGIVPRPARGSSACRSPTATGTGSPDRAAERATADARGAGRGRCRMQPGGQAGPAGDGQHDEQHPGAEHEQVDVDARGRLQRRRDSERQPPGRRHGEPGAGQRAEQPGGGRRGGPGQRRLPRGAAQRDHQAQVRPHGGDLAADRGPDQEAAGEQHRAGQPEQATRLEPAHRPQVRDLVGARDDVRPLPDDHRRQLAAQPGKTGGAVGEPNQSPLLADDLLAADVRRIRSGEPGRRDQLPFAADRVERPR